MAPSSAPSLIKGYLPVRLMLPPTWSNKYHDETYFYIREHQAKGETASNSSVKSTIFVANAPVVPGVSTKILLQSLFGRFADISRVTVVQNPRGDDSSDAKEALKTSLTWTKKFREPSFLPTIHSEGKFAHVVFETPKSMKKALRAMHDVMKPTKDGSRPGLKLEPIEIQTLSDESSRIYREERRKELGLEDDDDEDDEKSVDVAAEHATGALAVAARYRASCAELSREKLLEECNAVMQEYEDAEEAKRKAQEAAKSQPDEDGFITVTYSGAVGSQVELEQSKHGNPGRRKGAMRSRKKKDAVGSQELQDFYRFQRRENKKRTLEDLRIQFEEDLKRVKRMKEERHYRPF